MATRKHDAPAGFFHAINDHGTVVFTSEADFEKTWEPAGYRRMSDDEVAPVQMHEALAQDGDVAAIYAARREVHGHERYPVPPAPPEV
jgi:hypothetical protein